jgi:hypothetical protein
MTYLEASRLARIAHDSAAEVPVVSKDPGLIKLAEAVAGIAAAIEELARATHRDVG